jgi:sigma-B regulation protein RsbQ
MSNAAILRKFNVVSAGQHEPTVVMAHGFGSDQTAWRHQIANLVSDHRVVVFDHLGCGKADLSDYDPRHYSTFERYAGDLLAIFDALGLTGAVFVGHSVSAMIGMLAARARPELFRALIFVGASPRYLNDTGYAGGFTAADLDTLYTIMADDYLGWANGFGPLVIGDPNQPELGREFARTLSAMRPDIAQCIARTIFESDFRAELPQIAHPVLILQSRNDPIAPLSVGRYLADNIPGSALRMLDYAGHVPQLSDPAAVTTAIREFLAHQPRAS